ncbi:MAG: LysM peptidoglycan-binding domain-containing protein [Candidatus Limnocylindrales bacterium]
MTVPTFGAGRSPVEPPVCPLLGLAGDAATHFTFPTAGHRCHATGRPAPIELAQQGALCLSATYPDCRLFQQAVDAGRVSVPGAGSWLLVAPDLDAEPRLATAHPVDRIGLGTSFRPGGSGRLGTAAAPRVAAVVVVVVALLAVLAWRFAGSASSGPALATGASPTGSPTVSQSVAASASGSAAPSSQPSTTPSPSPIARNRTHVVAVGETLSSIAARFGVSLKALEVANHITDPNLIYTGERLIIPPP